VPVTVTLPEPRTPDPLSAPVLRWGILAPGGIARGMASSLRARTRQEIVAVGSRDLGRAQAFAAEFGIGRAHGSYEALVADPEVDVVYVASPHSSHREHALLAIEAGKHVLVEKAFARNAAEARDVVAAARARGEFCMEAMWTRFLPGTDVLRQAIAGGLLGDVEVVFADHGQPLWPGGPRRLEDPALAGGALLDLGIYPLSFASWTLGGIDSVSATGALTERGVDRQESMTVLGRSGGIGVLHSTMAARTPTLASVSGTLGRIDLGDPAGPRGRWYGPSAVRFTGRDESVTATWEPADRDFGLHLEACEVARCVAEGRLESELMPLDETVAIVAIMDEVRRQLGVTYPGE
jgi:predicted dehydrogenase